MNRKLMGLLLSFIMVMSVLSTDVFAYAKNQEAVAAVDDMAVADKDYGADLSIDTEGDNPPEVATQSGVLSIAKPSVAQLAAKAAAVTKPGSIYDVAPSTVAPYSIGRLSDSFLESGITFANYVRFAAGLSELEMKPELNESAQYGAVLLGATDILSHYPSQPSDMDNDFYSKGKAATSTSNLYCAYGYSRYNMLIYSTQGYMDDNVGDNNLQCLGHRRWMLNPALHYIGFGYAEGARLNFVDTKVFDRSGKNLDYNFISWPASGNFPKDLIDVSVPWSITLNPGKYLTPSRSSVKITVTRQSDGRVWNFDSSTSSEVSVQSSYFLVNTSGYGVSNCIIFGIGTNNFGTGDMTGKYTVNVTGIKSISGEDVSLNYDTFFCDKNDIGKLTGITLDKKVLTLGYGKSDKLTVSYQPLDAVADEPVKWTSSNNSIVTVDADGNVKGVAAGSAVVTATCEGFSATCTVTVNEPTKHDYVEMFVARLYTLVLNREADDAGINNWTTLLTNKSQDGFSVGYGFVFSEECKARNLSDKEYVNIMYRTFLNREADDAGRSSWVEMLRAGMDREYIFYGFVMSDEFAEICARYGIEAGNVNSVPGFADILNRYRNRNNNVTLFVARCYTKVLGRNADADGVDTWCAQIITGAMTPRNVAAGFYHSDEYAAKGTSSGEYVNSLYDTFLGRACDAAGYEMWTGLLDRGELNRDQVLDGFADSEEFAKILAGFGLN